MDPPLEAVDNFLREKGLDRIEFHGTDHAWGFRENEPIIALIAKGDAGMAFQAAMSLYWASAEYIPKPWCLFITVDNIALPHRQMLDNLASQYNIQLVSEKDLIELVKGNLENLLRLLDVYVPEESDNPIMALGESVRQWREEKPVNEYSFKVDVETGNLDIYKENGELVPSRKTIPLTASTGKARIEGILLRLIGVKGGLFFDTEHRNLPMVFKLDIGDSSKIVLRFEADKGNIVEATSFWTLFQSFTHTKRLAFIEPNTGDILFSCRRELDDRGNQQNSRRIS